ncbi:MAG: AtpZ/AtpI family protein [Deltaproteobacteria bacterium]|nr:AtpZ/AtpI family protein [Deltaproteobacteria bacterium]
MKDTAMQVMNASILGPEMGIYIGLGFFLGQQCDIHFNTTPIFTWVGLLFGIALAMMTLLIVSLKIIKNLNNDPPK